MKQPKPKPICTFIWEVAWSNPHKPRPEGCPEVILRVDVPRLDREGAQRPAEIFECWEEMRPYGYSIRVAVDTPPARRLPLESKQRIRRRNLWKRLLKKYPLLVSDMYAELVHARPEYYGPFVLGEFADLTFYHTTLGKLRMATAKELKAAA